MGIGKYLTFTVNSEEYAVPVLKVREIIKVIAITSVPQLPPYVKGVVNLRGKIIPIVDVRLKFGLPAQDYTDRTCIIVVEVIVRNSTAMMGLIVDSVSDVLNIAPDDLGEPPNIGDNGSGWVSALARSKGRVKILLDIDKLLGSDGDLVRAA